jgi:hypothetical protein
MRVAIMKFARVLGLFVAGSGLLACDGYAAGEYTRYRIATTAAKFSDGCFQDDRDKSSFRDGSTIMLFFIETEEGLVPYLDLGSRVLAGSARDEGFLFEGKEIDVEGDRDPVTITTTNALEVDMIIDGPTTTLSSKVRITTKCSSGSCQGYDERSCTATFSAVGVELDDEVGSTPYDSSQPAPQP